MDILLPVLEKQFLRLHRQSLLLIKATPAERFYWKPRESTEGSPVYSVGESILRSAGIVEQTFGGITTNLWDDPFEWTLPETLSSRESINGYLGEVEATCQRGFEVIKTDGVLFKLISMPSGEMQTINELLLDTLFRAGHHQGRAFSTFRLFSDARIPGM